MITHKISDDIILQFCPVKDNYYPIVKDRDDYRNIPLLVAEQEIEIITDTLKLINFVNLPLHYSAMVIAGCISIVLKYNN